MTGLTRHLLAPPSLGRLARYPWQIGWRGWRDIAARVGTETIDDRVMLVAGGVTFYALLSFFPAVSAAVSIYGLVGDQQTVATQFGLLRSALPDVGLQAVERELTELVNREARGLGIAFIVSLGLALWTANAAMKALFEAMNIAYEEVEERSFIRLTITSLLFTFASLLMFGVASAVVIALPAAFGYMRLGAVTEQMVSLGSAGVLLVLATVLLSALYRWGPCRARARLRWIAPGVLFALLAAGTASSAFSWYVSNFANYDQTYGSLGALVGFLTWIWIMAMVVIVGAEINAEAEHQTLRDSTVGAARALGDRGATVADTVGRSFGADARDLRVDTPEAARSRRLDLPTSLWLLLPLAAAISIRRERATRTSLR